MFMSYNRRTFPFVVASLLFFAGSGAAQPNSSGSSATSGPLYNEIAHMDSVLFDAFNRRDLTTMIECIDSSLELFQDNKGLRNFAETRDAFAELVKKDYVLTRTLVAGSMEVYPIKDYGAIQTGLHTFSHIENGRPESAVFKFLHIWRKQNGVRKITRLVTYDH